MTDAQRAKVRLYLGYSDQSSGFYSRLEGAITVLLPEGEEEVVCALEDLELVEGQLRDARRRQKVYKAEDVTLAGHDEIIALYKEGNRLAERISTILGTPILRYPFGSASAGFTARG